MKTQPVLRITETGAVEYHAAYPVEPIPYGVGDEQYYGCRMDEYNEACKEAESGFIPVQNKEVALDYIKGTQIFESGSPEPGIYPYTGEVKIEQILNYSQSDIEKGLVPMGTPLFTEFAILVEKPEAKEHETPIYDIMKARHSLAEMNKKMEAELESLRASNKELHNENERLKNDLLDLMDVKDSKGPTALSNVLSDRNRLQEANKELQEEISEYEEAAKDNGTTRAMLEIKNKELVEAMRYIANKLSILKNTKGAVRNDLISDVLKAYDTAEQQITKHS
jgi:hypothetical protein